MTSARLKVSTFNIGHQYVQAIILAAQPRGGAVVAEVFEGRSAEKNMGMGYTLSFKKPLSYCIFK